MKAVFNRYEKKYILTEPVYLLLRSRLARHMTMDQYGLHTICNIYYDTDNAHLIRRSIEKPVYKEKLRLRSYGVPAPDDTVFLEIKKKFRKVVNKRRVALPLRDAYAFLEKGIRLSEDSQIFRELRFFLERYPLRRALYLAYDRVALFGNEDAEFRVTFDKNIRSRREHMGLEVGDFGDLLLPRGTYLMESKVMGSTPLWFTKILSDLQIYPASFSKYGNIYKQERGGFDFDRLMLHREENWNNRRIEAC